MNGHTQSWSAGLKGATIGFMHCGIRRRTRGSLPRRLLRHMIGTKRKPRGGLSETQSGGAEATEELSRSLKLDRHLERREPRCRSIVGSVVSVNWT